MNHPALRGAVVTAAATVMVALGLSSTALAQADGPLPGDARATAHSGNPQNCAQAGLDGSIVSATATRDGTGRFVTITGISPDVTVTGVVVEELGETAYNVYPPAETLNRLHAPLNANSVVPQLKRAFVCAVADETTTTTTTTTTESSTTTTESSTTSSSSETSTSSPESSSVTTTTTAGGSAGSTGGSGGGSGGGLAATGVSAGPLVGGALVLLGLGIGLLLLTRRSAFGRRR